MFFRASVICHSADPHLWFHNWGIVTAVLAVPRDRLVSQSISITPASASSTVGCECLSSPMDASDIPLSLMMQSSCVARERAFACSRFAALLSSLLCCCTRDGALLTRGD
eukprot:4234430-Pleurochrysis_carterae.AAC.1